MNGTRCHALEFYSERRQAFVVGIIKNSQKAIYDRSRMQMDSPKGVKQLLD